MSSFQAHFWGPHNPTEQKTKNALAQVSLIMVSITFNLEPFKHRSNSERQELVSFKLHRIGTSCGAWNLELLAPLHKLHNTDRLQI